MSDIGWRHGLLLVALWLAAPAALAVIESYEFATAEQEARYQRYIDELRCPKCQNQNLAGSDAPIAADLRRELHRLITAGKTDAEIDDFMVARYGDFILYRPRVKLETLALWLGPGVMLLIGVVWVLLIARKSRAASDHASAELDADEARRLRALLEKEAQR